MCQKLCASYINRTFSNTQVPPKTTTTESIVAIDVTESAPPPAVVHPVIATVVTDSPTDDTSNVISVGSEIDEGHFSVDDKVDCSDMTKDFIPSMIDCTKVHVLLYI